MRKQSKPKFQTHRREIAFGPSIEVEYLPRRPGDPSRVVADDSKARQVLGWKPFLRRSRKNYCQRLDLARDPSKRLSISPNLDYDEQQLHSCENEVIVARSDRSFWVACYCDR